LLHLISSILVFYFQRFIFGGDWYGELNVGLTLVTIPVLPLPMLKNDNMIMYFLVRAVKLLREQL
jgi:hypothetical protein